MHALSLLSLLLAGALAALEAFGRLHYPLTWGTTQFDGALVLVAVICIAHALPHLRRRTRMGAIRFGSTH